jgi:3-oxoacyl-[acyl-carrier-protein] synthase II
MRRVVITGMGVVTPIGNDVETFWNGLKGGACGIDDITRFDTTDFKVKIAAEVKDFDPLLYMDSNEVRRSDLYVHYAMAATAQAMKDSGLEGNIDLDRFGVYVGSGIGGMITFSNEMEKLMTLGPRRISPFFVPMMIGNIASGSIAIKYHAQGPTLPVVTACATSTNAIGEAFRSIRHGYADAIIAGGAEATVCPIAVAGFTSCKALSTRNDKTCASIPFDKRRDGFVIGEGSGVVVVEEYEHAKARNAKIYGEIVGYGNTCDAYHITSPRPDASGAIKAIEQAISELDMNDISKIYVNAHGTSTPPNDKMETLATKKVFADRIDDVVISSTKSMTGHMLGAAGAVEAVACILALNSGIIPPTIGYVEKDEECDLDIVPNTARNLNVDLVMSNSFGFGGHNAVIAMKKI